MARNAQVGRILKVLHMLELNPAGLSARDILQRLNNDGVKCSRETVYRDLAGLQEAFIPIENTGSGDTAVWRLESVVKLAKGVHFSYQELMALYLARESFKSDPNSMIHGLMDAFFKKLELLFGAKAHQGSREFAKTMSVRPQPAWIGTVSREIMDTIHQSCAEEHILEIDYQSVSGDNAGKITTRTLGPMNMHFADSGEYLIAMDLSDNVVKTFALTRVKRAVMTDEAFESQGFEADVHLEPAFRIYNVGEIGDVELFVKEPVASYLADRVFHPSQRIVRKESGISFYLQVKINDELARWVLSLGSSAQVIKPSGLVDLVVGQAKAVIAAHKKAG